MLHPTLVFDATTTGGSLLVLSLVMPVGGILLAFVAGGRYVERVAFAAMALGFANTIAILVTLRRSAGPLVYLLGAWAPPLGVALRADGLSAVMMLTTAVVLCAVGVFAHVDFHPSAIEARAPFAFWILLLAVWASLNTVFLGGDLFTLYIALELVTFAAVPLVCLDGRAETLRAALRYLLFALLGSILYLVGTAMLYGTYGTLDIVLLSQRIGLEPVTSIAVALMTVGLLAKTALFPLFFWLPPAHADAPAAASAVLSALVINASFFIVVRLWFDVMPGRPGFAAPQLLAALGTAAIVFGSVLALRQKRLKLLVAYSTLAQVGYLFLMFPLALGTETTQLHGAGALTGGMVQAISHATAKAAMFMAAGLIYGALGHDRITELGGIGASVADERLRLRSGRRGADRCAAKRGLSFKATFAPGSGWDGAMVVGGRAADGRNFHECLPVYGACPRAGACRQAVDAACAGTAHPGSDGAGARAVLSVARIGSLEMVSLRSVRNFIEISHIHGSPGIALADRGWRNTGYRAGALGTSVLRYILRENTRRDRWPASTYDSCLGQDDCVGR
jgi:formate hydrogenlyase subunit 3/multisubunit Na+/H+ antiporter MnhD subunit